MSADTLRRAASEMREYAARGIAWEPEWDGDYAADKGWLAPAVALEVADLLDASGSDLWAFGPLCECGDVCMRCDDVLWQRNARKALAVARTFLGESSYLDALPGHGSVEDLRAALTGEPPAPVECCASGRCEVCSPGFDWGRDG